MSQYIQVNTINEGTHIVDYNCSDECGNESGDSERKIYIKGDGDSIVHGKIVVFPQSVFHPKNQFYSDTSDPSHMLFLYDSTRRIHNTTITTDTSNVNIGQVGNYSVYYSANINLPNGSVQLITAFRTVYIYEENVILPPIIRPPIHNIYEQEEISYLNFGTNPEVNDTQTDLGGGEGGDSELINELCGMYSISASNYQYNRKLIVRKNNNIQVILDESNSINLSSLYQELTKGDSTNEITIINNDSFELNPYVSGEDNYTIGPMEDNSLSYSGNWDILLIVNTDSNTKMEYGFLYDITNNEWKTKIYVINSTYVEIVDNQVIGGTTLEIAGLTINYISLCLDDPVISIVGDNPLAHNVGNNFTDPGANAVDDLGNNLTVNSTSNVNKDIVGSYTIIYSTTDTYGNSATATRTVNVNDKIAPVITIIGDNPASIQALANYNDQGATAVDNYDNSVNVTSSGSVNTNIVGSYTITYSASDSSGNTSTKTRTVNVVNTTAPTLTILGNNPYDLNVFTNFVDPGATATDIFGNSVSVSSTNNINKDVLGNYSVNYSATDSYGNTQTATRTVRVVDTTNPTITILGNNPMEVDLNGTYSEPGAVGNDNYTSPINVTITGSVNTSTTGTYTITYSASDSSGNSATATRTVNVVNNTLPTITLTGANPLYHEVKTAFTDPGATAQDVYGVNLLVSAVSTVNKDVLGNYTITYTATDNDGNTASLVRNVIVRDTTAPVITLIGSSSITLQLNSNYSDQGATATDNYDASVSVSTSGTVNTSIPATYVITYSATDSSGNNSTKTRNITVENNEPPVITVLGNDPVTLSLNATYTDAGATAVDAVGNSITVSSSSNVNTSQYGTYSVNYIATDIWGNTANARRNVIVSDFTAPTITLLGPQTMTVILGEVFTDPGATGTDPADGTVPVTSTGNVNMNVIGEYTITYRAEDSEGRETTVTRTVIVTSGPGNDTGSGGILGGGIPLSSSNFSSNGCININLSLPALSGYTGANPSINRAIIIRTTDNGGTPTYIYDNGTRNEYKYPNNPLNMSGTVFELEKSDPDYGLSIINDDGDFLEPQFYISSYNSDNWSNIAPVNDDYFGGNWEIISIQGNWSSGGSVTVTAFIFDIANTRWKTKSYTKSNTSGSIYKINNWSENTFNGAGPHDIAGITVKFNMECIIPQCANVGYSAASYSFDREIFTKYENSVISAWDETDNPSNTGSFEIMCAPYVMGGSVSVKNTQGKFLSAFPTSTTFTTGPVSTSDLSLDGNWELIITDYSNSSTNTLQHAIFYSGLYNKWYRTTFVFNNGIVSNMTTGEVNGTTITLSNITFTHNGFNDTTISKPSALGTTHTVIWLYSTNPSPTETASVVLDTTYPVSWSLSNDSNAGVLSHTNTGNLVITYRKDLVLNGGTSGFGGYVDYQFTYTATATILSNTFDYTINVTHRYYNPSSGGGGGGGDPPPPGDQDIIKDINDINDPFDPLDGL